MKFFRLELVALVIVGAGLVGCTASDESGEEVASGSDELTRSVQVTCSSIDFQWASCAVDRNGGRPVAIRVHRQISGTPCTIGQNFGLSGPNVWVNQGCRAEFDVAVRMDPR